MYHIAWGYSANYDQDAYPIHILLFWNTNPLYKTVVEKNSKTQWLERMVHGIVMNTLPNFDLIGQKLTKLGSVRQTRLAWFRLASMYKYAYRRLTD